MSQSNNISSFRNCQPQSGKKNILVSGCGITWSGQNKKTWANLLALTGTHVIDVGGPAVSNQWIINSAVAYLTQHQVQGAVIQLTDLGKLDVTVDSQRLTHLVQPDSLRNFTVDGVWPSSQSLEHESKKLWRQWLYSPDLEIEDIYTKLTLLKFYCDQRDIPLLVLSGYDIFDAGHQQKFSGLVHNPEVSLYQSYMESDYYVDHDHENHNTVPSLGYQFSILELVNQNLNWNLCLKIAQLKARFAKQHILERQR